MKKTAIFALFTLIGTPLARGPIPPISALSLDEKIGQLIMIATVSNIEQNRVFMHQSPYRLDPSYAEKMIKKYHIGGVIFMGSGTPEKQLALTEHFQHISRYPLIIGLDAEWGLSMRLQEGVVIFPRAMTLGALSPEYDYLIYELGKEIGRQCKLLGVHINFAPVADINNNPCNRVINTRSFGESPQKVAHKATLYMKGLMDSGILACGKHVPGHGDTAVDTHHGRCTISHSEKRLRNIELVPFKQLIDAGIPALMTAHIDVPALSKKEGVPATLSHAILTQLLRNEFEFDGLIITDGLGMKGITDDFQPGDVEVQALKAGNDILLCPVNVPCAIKRIKQAVQKGEIKEQDIDLKVARILHAKHAVICNSQSDRCKTSSVVTVHAQMLKKKLYQSAITLVRDKNSLLPLKKQNKPIKLITFGTNSSSFVQALQKHIPINHNAFGLDTSQELLNHYTLNTDEPMIISLHLHSRSGMIEMEKKTTEQTAPAYVSFIKKHAQNTILALFGNPYNLHHFSDVSTIIVGYENEPEAQEALAKMLLGKNHAPGILPVTPSAVN